MKVIRNKRNGLKQQIPCLCKYITQSFQNSKKNSIKVWNIKIIGCKNIETRSQWIINKTMSW